MVRPLGAGEFGLSEIVSLFFSISIHLNTYLYQATLRELKVFSCLQLMTKSLFHEAARRLTSKCSVIMASVIMAGLYRYIHKIYTIILRKATNKYIFYIEKLWQ